MRTLTIELIREYTQKHTETNVQVKCKIYKRKFFDENASTDVATQIWNFHWHERKWLKGKSQFKIESCEHATH